MSNRWKSGLVFLVLFLAVILVYWPTLHNTFILDDYVWIQSLSWDQVRHLFVGSWEHVNTLRPIMRLQFWSSRLLFGENPFGWHLTNIVLHTLVAWCAYEIVRKTSANEKVSFAAALIFAVFPTNHETVAWISGRTHPFGLLLSLAAAFLIYFSGIILRKRIWYLVTGFLLLLASFLTYEVSFVVPFALLFIWIIVGPHSRRALFSVISSFGLLGCLIVYRCLVLGGSIGSVGAQHDNIFLAPFLNFKLFNILYWHSRELKWLLVFLVFLLILNFVLHRQQYKYDSRVSKIILFFLFSLLSYAPFVITKGVAPRFLYSSLFFCFITLALAYDYLYIEMSRAIKGLVVVVTVFILILSFWQARQMAERYNILANSYVEIQQTLLSDFPVWPSGKDMLFYNIPNGYQGILAFLTYFDKAVQYVYYGQPVGKVYRADQLSPDELNKVLAEKPITYKFLGFDSGIIRQ